MTIDSLALQCFIAAAETASFTKAAEKVGRTQSAVSQQVAKLENLLGKILFRRGKILELTSDGAVFLNYARQIFLLHLEAIDCFREPDLKGEVRFGIPDDFASAFLCEVLSEFISIHPKISLHIECDLTLNLFEHFKKGKLDLVLLKMPCPQNFRFATQYAAQELCWVGRKNFVEQNSMIHKILPLVLSPKPCIYRKTAIEALARKKLKWRVALLSHSYSSKIAAVKAGLGITILPQKLVPKDLEIIHSSALPKLENIQISLLKETDENPAINSFENFLLKYLKPT